MNKEQNKKETEETVNPSWVSKGEKQMLRWSLYGNSPTVRTPKNKEEATTLEAQWGRWKAQRIELYEKAKAEGNVETKNSHANIHNYAMQKFNAAMARYQKEGK